MKTAEATKWPVWGLIREARWRARLSQGELAQRCGTSQAAISRYERARALPDLSTLHRIVSACNLELRFALEEPDFSRIANEQAAQSRTVEERLLANSAHVRMIKALRNG